MSDRLDKFLASLSGQAAAPARRQLHGIVELAKGDNIPRYRLVERLVDEGGSLRQLSSMKVLKDGSLSARFKGIVLVLGDGVNYWDPKEITPAGMRYAFWLLEAGEVRPAQASEPRLGRADEG